MLLDPILAGLHFLEKPGMPKLLEALVFSELQCNAAAWIRQTHGYTTKLPPTHRPPFHKNHRADSGDWLARANRGWWNDWGKRHGQDDVIYFVQY